MKARPPIPRLKRKYEVDESYWLVQRSRGFFRDALFTLRRVALTIKWGRVPKKWELTFIDRMRELEKAGLTFNEILGATLPQIFGDDTSEVLRAWIGRKARTNPERFARSVSKMFGASARNVLGSVDSLTDETSLFRKKIPEDPPYKSLLDAIRKSDEEMAFPRPYPHDLPRPD